MQERDDRIFRRNVRMLTAATSSSFVGGSPARWTRCGTEAIRHGSNFRVARRASVVGGIETLLISTVRPLPDHRGLPTPDLAPSCGITPKLTPCRVQIGKILCLGREDGRGTV